MAKIFEEINDKLKKFVEAQKVFFVATAPLDKDGHINLSPKGYDSFRILGPHRVAYLDLTGSGAETIAHLKENARICIMFCAFEGAAKILRFHGTGKMHEIGTPEFEELAPKFDIKSGTRGIIDVAVTRIADSCGWSIPFYKFESERDQLVRVLDHLDEDELKVGWKRDNSFSIDGLPAFQQDGPKQTTE